MVWISATWPVLRILGIVSDKYKISYKGTAMTLYERLCRKYTTLNINDFTLEGTILLGLDEDGNEVIESWTHPSIPEPTAEELSQF